MPYCLDMNNDAANWGPEIVPVVINGNPYTSSAGAIVSECLNIFGVITTDTLETYGVTSEIWQVCLAFWYHTHPTLCGNWSGIPCVST